MTIDDPKTQMPDQSQGLRMLPRGYFGPHITGLTLVVASPGLKRLKDDREKLSASAPEERR